MNSVYDPVIEWDSFSFPIEISNLTFKNNFHKLSADCVITIHRDESFNLSATISGHTLTHKELSNNAIEDGFGNFALADTISGYSGKDKGLFILEKCILTGFSIQSYFDPMLGVSFTANLILSNLVQELSPSDESLSQTELNWFVSVKNRILYPGITERFSHEGKVQKIRRGIDENINTDEIRPKSMSRDFLKINIPGAQCIISEVPKEYKVTWAECYCIEYRNSFEPFPATRVKKAVEDFFGFLLGAQLTQIGKTVYCNSKLIRREAKSMEVRDIVFRCQNGAHPPIFLNWNYEWGKIDSLIDKLFPVYLSKLDSLDLDGILWRYFRAKEIAVGVNLPVLSSALEKLVINYLDSEKVEVPDYYKQEYYTELISSEIETIEKKLGDSQDKSKILNKIKSAYKRGANEKMEFFFQLIGIRLSKTEKQALKQRNSMAHGGSDAKSMKKAQELILHTRSYETLFNRILLKLLGYEEYYIDYYLSGTKMKKINSPSGPPEDKEPMLVYNG